MRTKDIETPVVQPDDTQGLRFRWVMIGFAFFATIINYLDRQVLSVVAASPDFKAAVPLNNETYGYVTSAFMLAYAISNGLSGPFIDRVGTRIGYAACMLWWSIAGIVHIFARGAMSLGFFRVLLGVGEAGNWPAAAKLVSEWFPAKERALASGIFNSGASIGSVVSPIAIAFVVLHWGWQSAFVIMGVLGLVWVVGWWMAYRNPPQVVGELKPKPVSAFKLLGTRFVAFFTLSKVFMDPVWYFFVFWFPKFLADVHHFDIKEIGWKAWIPYFTAAIGNIAGGALTGLLIRLGMPMSKARKTSTAFFALIMLSTIPAILTRNSWLAIALVSVATFGYTGYTANTLAFPADVFPKSTVASIWGLASVGSGLGGMMFGALSGKIIQSRLDLGFSAAQSYTPVFIGYGIMPVLALLCVLFLIGPLRPHPRFAAPTTPAPAS